jgi:hypothetical protein
VKKVVEGCCCIGANGNGDQRRHQGEARESGVLISHLGRFPCAHVGLPFAFATVNGASAACGLVDAGANQRAKQQKAGLVREMQKAARRCHGTVIALAMVSGRRCASAFEILTTALPRTCLFLDLRERVGERIGEHIGERIQRPGFSHRKGRTPGEIRRFLCASCLQKKWDNSPSILRKNCLNGGTPKIGWGPGICLFCCLFGSVSRGSSLSV